MSKLSEDSEHYPAVELFPTNLSSPAQSGLPLQFLCHPRTIKINQFIPGIYNIATVHSGENTKLIGRKFSASSPIPHGVDWSDLMELYPDGSVHRKLVLPNMDILQAEDVRVLVDPKTQRIILGATALLSEFPIKTCPLLMEARFDAQGDLEIFSTHLYPQLNGQEFNARNITPKAVESGTVLFSARVEDERHTHILSTFRAQEDSCELVSELEVPLSYWSSRKIGTGGGQIMQISSGRQLLLMHGQANVPRDVFYTYLSDPNFSSYTEAKISMTQRGIYYDQDDFITAYGLGFLEFSSDQTLLATSIKPILVGTTQATSGELRKEKHANYSVDNPVLVGDSVQLAITLGDTGTAFAEIPLNVIVDNLQPIAN